MNPDISHSFGRLKALTLGPWDRTQRTPTGDPNCLRPFLPADISSLPFKVFGLLLSPRPTSASSFVFTCALSKGMGGKDSQIKGLEAN